MARNMHGVDQDNGTVQQIARESGVHAGFVVAMIEFYSDAVKGDPLVDNEGESRDQSIRVAAMVGAFGYNEQDDDDDIRQTELLRTWARNM